MTQFQNTEGKCTFVARRHFHPWRWVNFHDGIWNEDDVHSIENTLNTHNSQATRRCNSQASVTHTQCYNLESHNVTYRCSSQASEWLTVRMPCQSPTSRLKSRTHTITSPSNITYKPHQVCMIENSQFLSTPNVLGAVIWNLISLEFDPVFQSYFKPRCLAWECQRP